MPESVIVIQNQTLAEIAIDKGFNVDTLKEANPKAFPLLNPQVLAPGMEIIIPNKKKKIVNQKSGTKIIYHLKKIPQQFLSLKIQDPHNEIREVELFINGVSIPIQTIDKRKNSINLIVRTINPLNDGDTGNASLKLKLVSAFSGENIEKEIMLNIGGLDPIIDPSLNFSSGKETDSNVAKEAVQKILTNLGYYKGKINGKLDDEESQLAIARFQNDFMKPNEYINNYGVANFATCLQLKIKQNNQIGTVQPIKNGKQQNNK